MKKIAQLLLLAFGLCSATAYASVNLESYMGGDGVMAKADAKDVLSAVFLHNINQLDNVDTEVAKLVRMSDINIAFIYVGRLEDHFSTEIYTLILDKRWNVVDGALLGYQGDPILMEIAAPQNDVAYRTDDTQTYKINGDTIKVMRTYQFNSTATGGDYFIKEGTVYNNLLIRKDGKLVPLPVEATAILTEGDANYLSESHKQPTKTTTKGEFDGYGMNMMRISQTPISATLDMARLNKDAASVKNARKNSNDKRVHIKAALSAQWIINTGLREGDDFLTWIAQHPEEEHFTPLLLETLRESGMGEAEWLQQKVKALKDKKARKWWQTWMTDNQVNPD